MLSLELVKETNQTILEEEGTPERHHLRDRSFLVQRIDKANSYLDSSNVTNEDVLRAAASVLYGIAFVQSFADGNKRTALFTAYSILAEYNLERVLDIVSDNDYKTWRILNSLVNKRIGQEEEFFELLRNRFLQN